MSKVYRKLKEKTGADPTAEAYPGTILDFLLDRLACGVRLETIQADFHRIWHTDISEDEILDIVKGHEHEIQERRKQAAELIRKSNPIVMYLDATQECYQCLKEAASLKEKVYFLNALHTYLSIYVKDDRQKELSIEGEVSPDAVISLLDKVMGAGGQIGTGKRKREQKGAEAP